MTGIGSRNVYDQMPDRRHHGNHEANIRFLESTGLLNATGRILEIGSGKGELLQYLTEQGLDIEGVEINEEFVEEARKRSVELDIAIIKGTALPYDSESFDVVVSFDVLEHIPDTDAHLTEVRRVLKPNGLYLLQSPNKWTNTIFETIRWRSLTKWREHHCSLHSYYQFRKSFSRHGFSVEFCDIPVVTEYFRQKIRAYTGRVGVAMITILNPDRLPMPLRTNFYIKATKQ